ncbi:DUF2290 domain-containing protein [Acinetobacter sp. NIPH 2699]|uniref:DUF2290 domain-containing protein n=1 Tax=Acinetobacter sp. NIPH 2699 TaxID=2923433 RepID=UPI001F4ACA5B|nr:DUF2290 domain-containing protein [Acinetobacter sp. NIPH 2699]MCH7336185.1 DUF2290 domain-containing protein [Acinetobacter sp. NIPH 2699]
MSSIRPDAMAAHINKLCYEWEKAGLALASNNTVVKQNGEGRSLITWKEEGAALKQNEFSTLSEYLTLLKCSQYTMVLYDGSILQISYKIKRNEIIGHRLGWFPSPINLVNVQDIDEIVFKIHESLNTNSSLLEEYLTDPEPSYPINLDSFYQRSSIRFDYDMMPSDRKDKHPDVHLHISIEDCRIPVKGPLCLRKFMAFIVENFYPHLPLEGSLVNDLPSWFSQDMLTQYHRNKFHLFAL